MVADTFSATLGLLLMGTGNDNNTWGNNVNVSILPQLEDAIANVFFSGATSGTVDLSGTPPPAGPSQARFWQLKFTGSLTGDLTVQVPNLTKEWLINNQVTFNGHNLFMKTPSGSTLGIPQGWWRVWCDGNNVMNLWPQGQLQNRMPAANAAGPSYSTSAEPNSGFYQNTTQDWRFAAGGVDIFRFTGAGAGAPNLVDILSGNSLAFAGVKFDPTAIVPSGGEIDYDGIFAPTGWYFCDGSAKTRSTDVNLLAALTVLTTGNTHNNTTIDNLPIDLRNLGLEGAFIEISGASLGTTIVSINSASSMTVTPAITGTNTGAALRILPWGQGDGSTTFNVPDRRSVVVAGRDNMGGTARGLLTASTAQGILGTKLNAFGGEQAHTTLLAEAPTGQFTFNFNDPGHGHTTTPANPNVGQTSSGNGFTTGNPGPYGTAVNLTINSNTTGIAASISDHAGGGAHNNVQPTGIANKIIKR